MTAKSTKQQGKRLTAFVATVGDSLVAVRAWDVDDARARVIEQLRLAYLVGVAEDIQVRLATPADAALIGRFIGGSHLFRCEWAADARAQVTSSS